MTIPKSRILYGVSLVFFVISAAGLAFPWSLSKILTFSGFTLGLGILLFSIYVEREEKKAQKRERNNVYKGWNGEFGSKCNLPIDCVHCDLVECGGRKEEME